jgi:hypothetical protein
MRVIRSYEFTRFTPAALKDILIDAFAEATSCHPNLSFSLRTGDTSWEPASLEEFEANCATADQCTATASDESLFVYLHGHGTSSDVAVTSEDRKLIGRLFARIESHLEASRLPRPVRRPSLSMTKSYQRTVFHAHVLKEAYDGYLVRTSALTSDEPDEEFAVTKGAERWNLTTMDEFLGECEGADSFSLRCCRGDFNLDVTYSHATTTVCVQLPSRGDIQSVFLVLDRHAESCRLPDEENPVRVFIGHGANAQWRDLKDHLHEKHGYEVVAYELCARTGYSVKEVLEEMLDSSTFAVLVLTGEDAGATGDLHARENVIHEVGLFQGRLGFRRVAVLLESGCAEFSNIHGLMQVRFGPGGIASTFGEILATIRREFGSRD